MSLTPEQSTLSDVAARLRLAVTRTARRLRQEASGELTPTSAATLATVERHGPLNPSEVARIERIRRPSATRSIRALEDAGLVGRTPDPADGRSSLVSITAAGRDRLRRLRGRKNAYLARRMRGLAAEDVATLERAAEILERIQEGENGPAEERG